MEQERDRKKDRWDGGRMPLSTGQDSGSKGCHHVSLSVPATPGWHGKAITQAPMSTHHHTLTQSPAHHSVILVAA